MEYGFVNIEEQPHWLAKQVTFTRASSTDRVVQTYGNCRRFQVKSTIQYGAFMDVKSTIRYGDAIDAPSSQPGFEQVAGGMGGDPTPPLETGLEVDKNLDSARSPNYPATRPARSPRTAFIQGCANFSLRRSSNSLVETGRRPRPGCSVPNRFAPIPQALSSCKRGRSGISCNRLHDLLQLLPASPRPWACADQEEPSR